jgi:RND family efflux transporter MFP subunit
MEPTPAERTPVASDAPVTPVTPAKTRVVALAALAAIALLAGAFALGLAPRRARLEKLARAAAERDERPRVEIEKPRRIPAPPELRLPGDVRAMQQTVLGARAVGYLKSLHADLGDHVEAGQLLAVIDTPEVDAQLVRARADVTLAKAAVVKAQRDLDLATSTLERWSGFAEKGGVTPQDLDEKRSAKAQAAAALEAADASVAAAEAEANRLAVLQQFEKVTAPFAGTITARDLDVGALVVGDLNGRGRELFRLEQVDVVRVFVDVPQPDATSIRIGGTAVVTVRNYPGREFTGKVTRNAGALDPATRTLRCQVEVENKEGLLLPGMYGEVRIAVTSDHALLTIPSSAFVFDADGTHVWVVENGRSQRKEVAVGVDFGTALEVVRGLTGDEDVITNPGERLGDGVEVAAAAAAARNAGRSAQ